MANQTSKLQKYQIYVETWKRKKTTERVDNESTISTGM